MNQIITVPPKSLSPCFRTLGCERLKSFIFGISSAAAIFLHTPSASAQTAQSLPYSSNPGLANLTSANGWTQTGIGSDYSDTGSKIKFDNGSDLATLRVASAPGTVTFFLKGNGLSGSYVFDLLESIDGTSFTIARTITSGIGSSNTTFSQALLSTSRYIRWKFTTKATGNIGMGTISITNGATAPSITTGSPTSITPSAATLAGNITSTGGANSSERGIYYSTTAGFADGAGTKVSDLTGGFGTGSFTQTVTGLDPGTTYYFKAFATNTNGTGYGLQASFITVPAAPATPTASAVTSSGFSVSWDAVTGAASYRLDVATDLAFSSLVPSYNNLTVASTSQVVSSLDPSTSYYVRVRAVNAGGTSVDSATLTQATDVATEPVITLSPNTLSGLTVVYGAGASASQSFTVTGTNLSPAAGDLTVSAAGLDYEVSSDNLTFGTTATLPYTAGGVVASAHVRLKAGLAAGNYNAQLVGASGGAAPLRNCTVSGSVTVASPPVLTPAASASVDAPFDLTFTDNTLWRSNITGITVDGTPLTAGYSVTAGMITFTPAESLPVNLLRSPGSKAIVVQSSSHADASATQAISAGAATQMAITTQPTGPSVNGSTLAAQPVVVLRDQFNNLTASTATITAAVGAGTWTLGGTPSAVAIAGAATFSGLTATSAAAVTGATIVFSSTGLPDVTSATFNIIAPPPANDNPAAAISLAPNTSAISGAFAGSTPMTGATLNDVWYSFVAVGPSATVTINTFSPTGNKNLYVYSVLPTTYSTTVNVVASGITTSTTTETATAATFVPCTTYYVLVQDVIANSGTFNIAVTNTPSAPTTLPASGITTIGFTANWNPVPGVSSYRVDTYRPTPVVTTDLIFSEYVEGSSNNKYLEIYNGTAGTVNLSNYELRRFNNGDSIATGTLLLNSLGPATLASGATLVIRDSSAALTLPSGVTSYADSITNFNGDDALGLFKISTSAYVDIFGRIGNDPGTAWTSTSPSVTTVDKTLRRKSTVTSGITTSPTGTGATAFTTLGTEWEQYDTDTVSGLGSVEPIKTYLPGFQNADAGATTSLAVTGAASGTAYSYVVRAVVGTATSLDSDTRNVITTVVNVLPTFSGYTASTGINVPVGILESAVLANTSDANGDTVTITAVASTSTNGGTVSRSSGTITYAPLSTFSGTDTFSVTFSDGTGTVDGVITVNVIGTDPLFTDPTMNAVLSDQSGGVKRLSFTGIPGRVYGIQRSTTLTGWVQIDTVTAPGGGAVTYDDPSPPVGKGFYRIVYPAAPAP